MANLTTPSRESEEVAELAHHAYPTAGQPETKITRDCPSCKHDRYDGDPVNFCAVHAYRFGHLQPDGSCDRWVLKS